MPNARHKQWRDSGVALDKLSSLSHVWYAVGMPSERGKNMTDTTNKPTAEQLRKVIETASELASAIKALGPESRVPSYFNPCPEGWPELPWSQESIGNAYIVAVSLAHMHEEKAREWGIVTDDDDWD